MSAIIYLLQVSACMAIFYGFYYLMLNRLTFFTINRYYLLFTMLLSFVIPLLTIHLHEADNYPHVLQQVVYVNTLQNVQAYTFAGPSPKKIIEPGINWMQLLKMVYWLVAAGLFTHLVIVLIGFFSKLKYRKVDRIGKVNILRGNKKLTNGSFLNYIFLNDDELSADELQQIIAHEMLHVKLLHSVDRIIAKIIQIILWFNPFVYLYARSIEENHEFEVDREIARLTDKNNYADLLLHLSVAGHGMLYHNFSKVPLKKRMMMLFNKPSAKMKRVLYIGIIPVVTISCLAFARLKEDDKKLVDRKPFSIVKGLDKLGKTPLVLIDNEVYPSDILYKISSLCIMGTEIALPEKAVKKYGAKAKDGLVIIYTKNGRVITMTPVERENLVKEDAVPLTQFYTHLELKKENGKPYDKIIIHERSATTLTSNNEHGAKLAFFIDGKRVDENYIKKLSPAITATLDARVANPKSNPKKWTNVQDCESVIYFNSTTALTGAAKPPVPHVMLAYSLGKPSKTGSTNAPVQFPPPIVKPGPLTSNVVYNRYPNDVNLSATYHNTYRPKADSIFAYLRANDVAGLEKYLPTITNKIELFLALNEVAWQLAMQGKNLEIAERLSKQSVDIVNDLLIKPIAGPWGVPDQARYTIGGHTAMVGDTYAYILYKEHKYDEALKVQQPIYDRGGKAGSIVTMHYVQILIALNNYAKAKEVLEVGLKSDRQEVDLEPTLKETYIKLNGSDKGYDEYFKGLNVVSKSNMGMMLNPAMQIQVRSQMRYVSGFSIGPASITGTPKQQVLNGLKKSVMIPNARGNASYVTDTIEFNAKSYNVKPTDHLPDLLKLLPGITLNEKKAVFFQGKPVNNIMLLINSTAVNNAAVVWGHTALLTDAPANMVDKVRIIDPDKKMTMTIIMGKNTDMRTIRIMGDSIRTGKPTH